MLHTFASCIAVFTSTAAGLWIIIKPKPPSRQLIDNSAALLTTSFIVTVILATSLSTPEAKILHWAYNELPGRPFLHCIAVVAGVLVTLKKLDGKFVKNVRSAPLETRAVFASALGFFVSILMIGGAVSEATYMLSRGSWQGALTLFSALMISGSFLVCIAIHARRELFGEMQDREVSEHGP